jgi:hypothetical protein
MPMIFVQLYLKAGGVSDMMSSLSIQADPPKPVVQQAPAVASSVIRPQQAPQTRAPAVSI